MSICTYDMPAADVVALAGWAEEAGFASVWVGEHLVVPSSHRSEHPVQPGQRAHHHGKPIVDPSTELVDPIVALAAAAGATSRVGLATGIYILPLRHPLVTARAAVTAHEVSGGRFFLGVGSGWLAEEFDALQVPFAERRTRYDESIDVLRAAWAGGPFSFTGTHFQLHDVQVTPRPVPVPLIVGGNTEPALHRAARVGDGWISSGTPTFAEAVRLHDRLRDLAGWRRDGREFRVFMRMPGLDPNDLERYQAEGITDVVVWAHAIFDGVDREGRRDAVLDAGHRLGLRIPVPT